MSPDDKNNENLPTDIPASIFEEALRAVEKIKEQTRENKKRTKSGTLEPLEVEIPAKEADINDIMKMIAPEKKPPAKGKARTAPPAQPAPPPQPPPDSDLNVLTQLLEQEYNLEKETDYFRSVLVDNLQKESGKIDEQILHEKEGQIQVLMDRLINIQGEFEKFRQRLNKEAETAKKFSNETLILQLIPILDNLERAIEHAESTEEKASMVQGVRLIYKQMLDMLTASGVEPLEAKGRKFDPNYHEAIASVETEEVPPNIVISEYQKGYLLFNRLLRASRVVVSRLPEKDDEVSEKVANPSNKA